MTTIITPRPAHLLFAPATIPPLRWALVRAARSNDQRWHTTYSSRRLLQHSLRGRRANRRAVPATAEVVAHPPR